MAKHLYILAEGEMDELFYERICERVAGASFERSGEFALRHGSNWKTALAAARLLFSRIKHWKTPQDIAVVVAVDNDRSPGHPGAKPSPRSLPSADRSKNPRYSELVKLVEEAFQSSDRAQWPVDVALAVPVEMFESWLLILMDSTCADTLPLFAEASQKTAREYHGGTPPPQLKDRVRADRVIREMSRFDHVMFAADQDLEAASQASPSFAMFLAEIRGWRR